MKKVNWTNLKDSPIWTIAIIIVASVSFTYYIINYLIVEHYKLEIHRLEKIIDQRNQIENLDSITVSLRNILDIQTKIVENKHTNNNQVQINKRILDKKWIRPIDNLIIGGNSLLTYEASSDKTFNLFDSWRIECISLLNQIDSELKTDYKNDFITLTRLDRADYPQLKTKINDGLSIIKTIKLYY